MAKKQALGRGLGALLGGDDNITTGGRVGRGLLSSTDGQHVAHAAGGVQPTVIGAISTININSISENPDQPRRNFDEQALEELATSIREHGIIQPITVRKIEGGYQLISGERRLRASKIAGLSEIPAYIRMVSENKNMLELALIENIQRENLNALDIALSYQGIQQAGNYTQEELSKRVGKDRATISNYLRLLNLPADVQLAITENRISMGHARAMLAADNPEKQVELLRAIFEKHLSVRQVETLAAKKPVSKGVSTKKIQEVPFADKVAELSKKINADVGVKMARGGKGSISITFPSKDHFEKILNVLIEK
ncbi:MAG: ParB/RepB/Spo0J family partition protein [Bacteroidales bacterium]|jgi:ParB family chromosome partitioning protein|nr:ParB/RepB/Spo0J family partition protein [Bacteroidales bacterium]